MTIPQITVHNGRVREPGVLAATSLKFNLDEEIRQLKQSPAGRPAILQRRLQNTWTFALCWLS